MPNESTQIPNQTISPTVQQSQKNSTLSKLQQNYDWLPYLYAIIGNISLAFLQINLKIVTYYITPLHALSIRGFLLLFINSILLSYYNTPLNISDKQIFRILMKRIALSCVTVSMFLGSIKYIPMGTANALFSVGPVVVCFIEAWRYKKPLNKIHFVLTTVCFIGILMVIQPQFLFGYKEQPNEQVPKIFMVFCLISAFTNAFSMLYLHDLKGKVSSSIALQYFYIGQALFNSLAMTFQQINFQTIEIDLTFFLSIFGLVFFAYATQNFITRAMLLKKPSYIMPFGYVTLVVSTITDKIIFGNSFSFFLIVGMVLTSSGLLVKLFISEDDNKKNQQK